MTRSITTLGLRALAMAAALACVSPAMAADAESRARAHLTSFPGLTMHGANHSYKLRDTIIAHDGSEHVRFERLFRGMRVIGGDLVVHSDRNGNFNHATHTLRQAINVPARAAITAARADTAALASHAGELRGGATELVVYARAARPALAWSVRIDGVQDDGTPSEKTVIVDAQSGLVLETWDDIHTAPATGTGNSFFGGVVQIGTNSVTRGGFEMRDPTRGGQYTTDMRNRTSGNGRIFKDTDNTWGNGALTDRATVGVDAHYGTAVTWDYYKNVHGRTGIRNDGVGAFNRVHYSTNYANAFWSDSCFCMTYGDGNATTFYPLDSLDVAGHEMSHGVTSNTAGLIYSGESGGLNEATSDIFGSMVEYYANNSNDPGDYKIGEEIYRNGTSALRYMYSPNLDTVSADCWYAAVGGIDVHYSSGIANHFFYMLAEGTHPAGGPVSPTCVAGNQKKATGNGVLAGIGRAKAERIWFVALTQFMTSSTNYAAARVATLNAANSLYGAGSPESSAVAAAWSAVLVN